MTNVSESLNEAIENFLEFTPQTAAHLENTENPHTVTKQQVGLGNVDNEKQATKTEFDMHTANEENPHSVTKTQVGLGNVDNEKQATKTEFDAHTGNTSNPHTVTKQQVGLGDVDNVKQATSEQYAAHISGLSDKHSGNDVLYSPSKSVSEKINELIISGGGGTMYHDELLNRSNADQHPMSAVTGLADFAGKFIAYSGVCPTGGLSEVLSQSTSPFLTDGRLIVPAGHFFSFDICAHFFIDNTGSGPSAKHKILRKTVGTTLIPTVEYPMVIEDVTPPTVTVADITYNVDGSYPLVVQDSNPLGDVDISLRAGFLVEGAPDEALCMFVDNGTLDNVTACISVQVLTHYVSPNPA